MADAVVTTVVTKSWADSAYHVIATSTINASPATYAPGGLLMNLNQSDIKASRTPLSVQVTGLSGYEYRYSPGTDNSNGYLGIFAQTSGASAGDPLAEIPTAAIPAAVSSDTLTVEILYRGMM